MSDEAQKSTDVDTSKLSKDAEKVLEMVEKMSLLELAELVKVMEDKFGVSAAAPVAVASAGGGGDAGADAGSSKKNVELTGAGGQKISVIKVLREITGLGLKEAKEMVDSAPKMVKEGIEADEAEKIKKQLEEAGATVTIK